MVNITGTSGNDPFNGTSDDDWIDGQEGNDMLIGFDGADTLHGHFGSDLIDGGAGDDELFGNSGFDILSGGQGHDTLKGGDGNDTLRGGDGAGILSGQKDSDRMWGVPGADSFVFSDDAFRGVDYIADFRSGLDQIYIKGNVVSGSLNPGQLDAALFSTDAAVGTHGQFVLMNDGGVSPTLLWDSDGIGEMDSATVLTLGSGLTMTALDIMIF